MIRHFVKSYRVANVLKITNILLRFLCMILVAQQTSYLLSFIGLDDRHGLYSSAFLLVALVLIFQVTLFYFDCTVQAKIAKLKMENKIATYKNVFSLKLRFLNHFNLSQLNNFLYRDLETILSYLGEHRPQAIAGIISAIGYILYIAYFNIYIALIILLVSFLQLIPPYIVNKYLQVNYLDAKEAGENWMTHTREGYDGLATIKSFGLKKWYLDKMALMNKKYMGALSASFKATAKKKVMDNTIVQVSTVGVYIIILYFVWRNILSLDDAIKIFVVSRSFFVTANSVFSVINEKGLYNVAVYQISVLFDMHHKTNSNPAQEKAPLDFKKRIQTKDLSFSYPEATNKIIFDFNDGEDYPSSIAFIDKNGTGKTTFIKVMLKLIEGHKDGKLLLFGREIDEWDEKELYNLVTYVDQNDTLCDFQLEELLDILKSDSRFDKERFFYYCKRFRFPIDGAMSQTIQSFSGGERKKLSLSIALSCKSEIIILDEPTNNLDSEAVTELCEIIEEGIEESLLIVISHNEKVTKSCDSRMQVVV